MNFETEFIYAAPKFTLLPPIVNCPQILLQANHNFKLISNFGGIKKYMPF